jgi:Fur family ferric uptake transcriptional regulator
VETRSFLDALDQAGFRDTGPRRATVHLIAGRDGHFTAADVMADARDHGLDVGRATVFRALDLFIELHLVERLDLPTGEHTDVTCDRSTHHHHIVCSSCGRNVSVEDAGLAAAVEEIQRSTGWQVESHRLELHGHCPRC